MLRTVIPVTPKVFLDGSMMYRGVMQTYTKTLFSRALRREATPSERLAWDLLRGRRFMGLKFRRQHVFRGFVADFYCAEHKLVVEIDGKIHERRQEYDALRQGLMEDEGVCFIRVTSEELTQVPEVLLDRIQQHLMAKSSH